MAKKKKEKEQKTPSYPRHSLEKSLRIPKAILDQNAGKDCTDQESARYCGVKFNNGPYMQEVTSAIRYKLLERPEAGKLKLTDTARKILKPQSSGDVEEGLKYAAINAPVISDVYSHYRGENLPSDEFFNNALMDNFKIPAGKLTEFREIFFSTMRYANLVEDHDGKLRLVDATTDYATPSEPTKALKKLEKSVKVKSEDACFVMMPFAPPLGTYYEKIYKIAIEKAGLTPMRADDDLFGTGKIMDQIWNGINAAKVLVADLTSRNPNVYYELGLAHALHKPVVLISNNQEDVPFDLNHIRVIYYDMTDPFWGQKLVDKVAENILSAIKNPEEAIFKPKE
jgi:hypothetical protein